MAVNGMYRDKATGEFVAAISRLDRVTDSDRVKVIYPDGSSDTVSLITFEREYKPADGKDRSWMR